MACLPLCNPNFWNFYICVRFVKLNLIQLLFSWLLSRNSAATLRACKGDRRVRAIDFDFDFNFDFDFDFDFEFDFDFDFDFDFKF